MTQALKNERFKKLRESLKVVCFVCKVLKLGWVLEYDLKQFELLFVALYIVHINTLYTSYKW